MTNADLIEAAASQQSSSTQSTQRPRSHQHILPLRWFYTASSTSSSSASPAYSDPLNPSSTSFLPSSPSAVPKETSNEPTDFLPSTTLTNRFKNFYRMATKSMTPAGAAAYWADADARYSAIDCARCESQRDYLLSYSPIIRYMRDNIARLGGELNSSNIRCRTCKTDQLGGFDAKYGIMLCANYIDKRSMLEDVLAHEMVHAYDHLRFKTDLGPEEDLKKAACAEIRASNLSGECRWSNEFFRNKVLSFTNHHQECVRRRAVISVKMRPNCGSDLEAVRAVNEVWDSCFRDTRPFDEIYR